MSPVNLNGAGSLRRARSGVSGKGKSVVFDDSEKENETRLLKEVVASSSTSTSALATSTSKTSHTSDQCPALKKRVVLGELTSAEVQVRSVIVRQDDTPDTEDRIVTDAEQDADRAIRDIRRVRRLQDMVRETGSESRSKAGLPQGRGRIGSVRNIR